MPILGRIAQLVEQRIENPRVPSSILGPATLIGMPMSDLQSTKSHSQTFAWMVWFIAALFYAYEFSQRVMPGIIAKPLMSTFHLNASALGSVDSLYFYAYAISQIFVGLILDKFGVKICIAAACLVVAIGTFSFAHSDSVMVLGLSRVAVGVGSAFAFVGCLKLAATWFPVSRFALLVGLTNMLGTIGALFGEEPLSHLVQTIGWQESLVLSALIGVIITVLIVIVVSNSPHQPKRNCDLGFNVDCCSSLWRNLVSVLKHRQTWLVAIYAGIMVAPVIAFAELWAVPFLEISHHLAPHIAAQSNSLIFVGIAVGAPLNGLIAGWLKRRKVIMLVGNLVAIASLLAIIWETQLSLGLTDFVLFLFGYFTSTMLLCFSINTQSHSMDKSGTVIAFTNMMIMVVGAAFQPLIGKILDMFGVVGSHIHYNTSDYHIALMCLPVALVINLLLLAFIKEAPYPKNNTEA